MIDNILHAVHMTECHAKATPTTLIPLGSDDEGPLRKETWHYGSIIGMLLYLAGNTRPDIAFAVNQAARYMHRPKQIHEEAIKHLC